MGTDAIDGGIDVADLEDGAYAWMVLAGENLYGHVSKIGDTYYIAAVPESDMAATRNVTVGVILFIFFAVMAVVIMYGIFVMREDEREGRSPEDYRHVGPLRYNKVIGRKAAVLSFVGFLAILGVSFYMQTLFALSSQSVANNERAAEVVETTQRTQARMDELISPVSYTHLDVYKRQALAGLAASAAFAWWGAPVELGALVSSWLVPLAVVAGASAFVAVWSNAPWSGAVVGAVLVPLVVPVGRVAAGGGALSVIAQLQGAVGPGAMAAAGCVLLAVAVVTARRALVAHMEAA